MKEQTDTTQILRTAGFVALLAGAAVAIGFTLYTGRYNKTFWLILLFVCWVSSPFACLALGYRYASNWKKGLRITLYCLSIVICVVSSLYYSGVLKPANVKPAFVFLAVPFLSWVVLIPCLFALRYLPAARGIAPDSRRSPKS